MDKEGVGKQNGTRGTGFKDNKGIKKRERKRGRCNLKGRIEGRAGNGNGRAK
jgi:hypothetical protein